MPAPHIHTFYQYAYLKHPPRRYALLRSEEALRRDQKHDEHYRTITAALLARHLASESDLTAPVAGDCRTHLPSLDVAAGGIVAIHALICEATQRARATARRPRALASSTTGMSPSRRPCAGAP